MTHPERKYTIGRSPTCDIVLADESVSRIHAELTFLEDGKLLVTDCRSTQGTALMHHGGEVRTIRQELVSPLDTLRFGAVSLPVKELLQAIHLKYPPVMNGGSTHKKVSPVAPKPPEGEGLVRCECGAVKVKNSRCEVCDT
jgi:pSer/pThr/pTyr-binding forkhead associated (FHA) protein